MLIRLALLASALTPPLPPGAGSEAEAAARREDQEFEAVQPPMPEHLLALWRAGSGAYACFQREFHSAGAGALTPSARAALKEAAAHLEQLAGFTLGERREFILYGRLQDVFVPLARELEHCADAASWSLQRALHPLGTNSYAVDEASKTSLWNAGVSAAIGFYRRAGDQHRAQATLELARKHPHAATHYERLDQTPLVFFPGLEARPWWEPRSFSLVRKLESAFADPGSRAALLAELDAVIARGGLAPILSPAAPLGEAGAGGGEAAGNESGGTCGAADGAAGGATPAWSELPLFDGRVWDEGACAALPTLRALLRGRGSEPVDECICTAPVDAASPNLCGTNIVVTLLRLAPGAAVLPHCGITNRRLTMQFALRGAEGVEFTVGGEPRGYGGDGKAIVFDDSFEHRVQHRGSQDRYVLYAVLKHPGLTSCPFARGCHAGLW